MTNYDIFYSFQVNTNFQHKSQSCRKELTHLASFHITFDAKQCVVNENTTIIGAFFRSVCL